MANTKISALSSATTPLAGTEVLPIVQSSATVKVATNDLTVRNVRANATTGILQITGPAAASTRVATVPDANWTAARTDAAQSFTGDQTLSTGNLIQGTAAKGFNFTANSPAAGMTSQLLNWYEEGIFTATATGMTTSPTGTVSYTRVGRIVTLYLPSISGTSNSTSFTLTGLPTPVRPTAAKIVGVVINDNGGAYLFTVAVVGPTGIFTMYANPSGGNFTASGTKSLYNISVTYSLY